MIKYDKLKSNEQVSALITPILQVIQDAGGQLNRIEIRERICELYEEISEFEQTLVVSKSGREYRPFSYRFNFAIKELQITGFLSFTKNNPKVTLTEKGNNVDIATFNVETEVRDAAKPYWDEHNKNKKKKSAPTDCSETENEANETIEDVEDDPLDEFRIKLQSAIANMSPEKFERFSRALLTKMGVQFSDKIGVKVAADGGIDGYGYHVDDDDFRTTRVVIQCKRFNTAPVGETAINEFLGAMNKFQADYGVFITNSRFTSSAKDAARQGTPITLIDGTALINLVIKYELFITPVTTYVLDDFYTED